jgi:Asp-tRNA(Asn)/Glu-tRNA(Gln) amidotransferase A subunit family amidase
MTRSALERLDAVELARGLARREIRAQDLMRACLDRIAEREPQVHAFAHLAADAALEHARQLDAGALRGPLHGLPLGVKDLFDTHDMPGAYGSPIYSGHRASWDAAAVALCRDAGAIVVGKTVTTEFATFHPGPTRNPHDTTRTPGGSSSGSAAAVADHLVALALGTQTAASIIRPAAFCGVVGFKPSIGRTPRAGMKLLSESLDTVGGFGRSVADAGLLASVLTGDARLQVDAPDGATVPRVGGFQGPDWARADADTRALWDRVSQRLATLAPGSSAVATPAWFEPLASLQTDLMLHEAARGLTDERLRHADLLSPRLSANLSAGLAVSATAHATNLIAVQRVRQQAASLFGNHDLLIAPSAIGEAGPAADGTGDPVFCRAWTLLGLPCLHLPLGVGRHGLPIGLQLIGRFMEDERVLQAGAWLHPRLHD